MSNDSYFQKKLEPIKVTKQKPISQLLKEMGRTAYQGRKLGEAVDVWENMIKEKDTVIVLGFAGSMSTAGQWTIINWLIENRFIDVLVSTGANVSEDIVDAMGFGYWQGSHMANDEQLLADDVNRYYDVYGKETDYRKMEEVVTDYVMTCKEDYYYTSAEFLHGLGKYLDAKNIPAITSIAAKHNVPIFSPAMVDSAYGETFLLAKNQGHNVHIDSVKEFDQFVQIGTKTKDVGVIYIGGGVPKDITQLIAISVSPMTEDKGVQGRQGGLRKSLQEYYYPHKYAIQITTDSPQWGGLSGCTLEEAISWGKINNQSGTRAVCYCDATIALPLICHALAERVTEKRDAPDMSWIFKDMPKV
ncbi:MAG: deoxyhypusine synthase [Candidatus Bathyarchaeota archaeon]|nr:deoxyhypusine synthase [Candidatus Termiticorpusculum sp.]MCL1970170.1 deoxyhypusine synthase [Candidatus Termiticorpusculum sp.]